MAPKSLFSPRQVAALVSAAGFLLVTAGPVVADRANAVPAQADTPTIAHVLNRIGFGARPGDVERVQRMGLAAYIDEQLHPERMADGTLQRRLTEFGTLSMSSRDLAEKYYLPAEELRREQQLKAKAEAQAKPGDPAGDGKPRVPLPPEVRLVQQAQQSVLNDLMQARVVRAAISDRQLDEVLVDFWFNHFNVFVQKGEVRQYLTEYERDVIRPHLLGHFRDLLGAVAHSPAMLFYLDNWQSSTPYAPVMISPEMELRLRTARLSPIQQQQLVQRLRQMQQQQGKQAPRGLNENYGRELMELHTLGVDGGYTQQDVVEVARALTGWTIANPRLGGGFVFNPRMHDTGAKTILGVHFPAGGGQEEGERVLDILARHPSTAHHIAFQLAQRFVADVPPASLVDRAAQTFLDTKGDLREVVRVIITSPEFFSADAYRAKVKTPLEFVVSAVRASGAIVANGQPLVQELRVLGMPLYGCQPPTGYSMTADAWVNTGSLLNRMNFALQLVSSPGPGPQVRAALQVDLSALTPNTSEATRDQLIQQLFAGRVSDTTRQTLARAETPQQLLALALGSPEFQRR